MGVPSVLDLRGRSFELHLLDSRLLRDGAGAASSHSASILDPPSTPGPLVTAKLQMFGSTIKVMHVCSCVLDYEQHRGHSTIPNYNNNNNIRHLRHLGTA